MNSSFCCHLKNCGYRWLTASLFMVFFITLVPTVHAYPPQIPGGTGLKCDLTGTAPYKQTTGVGTKGQGAGAAVADINVNGKPDLVLLAYDNPAAANSFRYRIGWDLTKNGATSWTPGFIEVGGVGTEAQGAGVAIADIDQNGTLDMVLMAYDNPKGPNTFRYRIGWNLNHKGVATNWSAVIIVPGVGTEAQGAGISIADIDQNGTLDMMLMAYDDRSGAKSFRYKIGWDLDNQGKANKWSASIIAQGIGSAAQGADIALTDVNLDGELDLILMNYYNPKAENLFHYRVGWTVAADGKVKEWSRWFQLRGFGKEADGAGLGYYDLTTLNPDLISGPALVYMAYDAPSGSNNFRYNILPLTTAGINYAFADDPPPAADNKLVVPTSWATEDGERLFNLNMKGVRNTAWNALSTFLFNSAFNPGDDAAWYDYPDHDVNFAVMFSHSSYRREIAPDLLVAAVAWYVDQNMGYTYDNVNDYVLNTIFSLNYFAGAHDTPAYYTFRYTNPYLNSDLIKKLKAKDKDWAKTYNDGMIYHGDCEDYAIFRHSLLRALGFDRRFIWNVDAPSHVFNIVLYKGTYRVMDYGPIHSYLCCPSSIVMGIFGAWNQDHVPATTGNVQDWFDDHVLPRVYPDRCGLETAWLFSRQIKPDIEKAKCKAACK